MESLTCPRCQAEMVERQRAGVTIPQCTQCEGIFLDRADRGIFAERENDWHTSQGPQTRPLPRITPDMDAPPQPRPARQARSFVDALFG